MWNYKHLPQAEYEQSIKEWLEKHEPFLTSDDVPELDLFPNDFWEYVIVPNLIRLGAIPKKDLVIGAEYEGSCRNSSTAVWTGKHFEYMRYKWGSYYVDNVNHFEDDDGYDVFIPIKCINENKDSVEY